MQTLKIAAVIECDPEAVLIYKLARTKSTASIGSDQLHPLAQKVLIVVCPSD